ASTTTSTTASTTTTSTTTSTNPVQADLTKIKADQKTLRTDTSGQASTIRKDNQAIQTAITNSTGVQAAKKTLNADQATPRTPLKAHQKAISGATGDAMTTAINQLHTDQASSAQTIQADQKAIQTAITNDAGVKAAQAQLQTDTTTITKDQAIIQVDEAQL